MCSWAPLQYGQFSTICFQQIPHKSVMRDKYRVFFSAHQGWVTQICISKWEHHWFEQRQAIIWTNADVLLTGPLGTNVSKIKSNATTFIQENEFENVIYKMVAILCCSWHVTSKSNQSSTLVIAVLLKYQMILSIVITEHDCTCHALKNWINSLPFK